MNKKRFWKVMALMLVLVLTFALLAACDMGGGKPNPDEDQPADGGKNPANPDKDQTPGEGNEPVSPPGKMTTKAERQEAFLDTLFNSANEIAPTDANGNPVVIDTAEGKDIGFDIGLTITVTIDDEEIPVSISAKAFLDRVANSHDQEIDEEIAPMLAEKVLKPDAAEKEKYVKDTEYPDGTKYFCKWYDIDNTNKTVLDVCIRSEEMEAIGIYYAPEKSMDSIYVTLGGSKYDINLKRFIALDEKDEWAHSLIYNMCERLVTSEAIGKIVDAFNAAEGFNLNDFFSSLLNDLLKDVLDGKTLYDTIKDLAPAEGGNNTLDISGIIFELFGGEDKAKENLGEKINVLGLLKSVKGMVLSEPTWEYRDAENTKWITASRDKNYRDFNNHINGKLDQPLKAYADIDINVAGLKLQEMTILKDGHIRLGYEKAKGEGGKTGKLENFWIELLLKNIADTAGEMHDFGVKIQIDALSFNVAKDPALAEKDVSGYGPLAVEAEAEAKLGKDAFEIFFGNDMADYHVSFGNDKLEITDGEIKVPKSVKVSVKGAVDLAASEGTKIVFTMTCAGSNTPLAIAQIYGLDNKDSDKYRIVADVKADKAVLDKVTGIVKKMSDGRPMGDDGFAWDKTLEKWGFWDGDGTGEGAAYTREYKSGENYSLKGVSEALDAFLKSGELHLNDYDPFDTVRNAKGKTPFINHTSADNKTAKAAAEIDPGAWIMEALLNADKDTGAITLLANLFSFASGRLTVGGDNLLADVFNNALYHMDPDKTDILPSIYSMLGYFGDELTDVRTAYEYLEKKVYEFNTGYTIDDVGYIRPASSGKNGADKLIEKWNTAADKGEITAELESKGYAVIATNIEGTAAVHYPMNLFNLTVKAAEAEVGKITGAGQADKDLGDGFKLVELAKDAENLANVTEQTLWNGKAQRHYQIISKSIEELKADYAADPTEENAVLLMRRGEVCKKVGDKVESYDGVLIDEQMLAAASLKIMPDSTEENNVITSATIKADAAYDGSEASLNLSLKVIKPGDVKIDKNLVSADCVKISLELK